MKQLSYSALKLFLILYWIFSTLSVVNAKEYGRKIYYITPIQLSSQNISPCDQNLIQYHNDSTDCFVMTLNEFSCYKNPRFRSKFNELVIFLHGMHILNSSQTQVAFLHPHVYNGTIMGIGRVTIMCMKPVEFSFSNSRNLKISNIHFVNCYCNIKSNSTLNFELSTSKEHHIVLEDLQITGKNIKGIRVVIYVNNNWREQTFKIRNSIISTENVGLMASVKTVPRKVRGNKNQKIINMNIDNVTFHNSCLSLTTCTTKSKKSKLPYTTPMISYKIANSTFIQTSCISAMSFNGTMEVALFSVTIRGCQSQYVLYSILSSLLIQGHCYFSNNQGTLAIKQSNSQVIVSKASLIFINNSVKDSSVLSVEDITVNVSESRVTFKKNYGQMCAGIIAKNATLLFQHDTTLNFIGNHGEGSGAVLLDSISEMKFIGSGISEKGLSGCRFIYNNGPTIISSTSKIEFINSKVEFFHNSLEENVNLGSIFVTNGSSFTFRNSLTTFTNNSGGQCCGMMVINNMTKLVFENSEANFLGYYEENGGEVSLHSKSVLTGPTIVSFNSKIEFQKSRVHFFHNSVGGNEISLSVVLVTDKSFVAFKESHVTFKNNSGGQCGGIMAMNMTNLVFENSQANFLGNYGENGGAVSLHSMSVLTVEGTVSQLIFSNNRAQKGGAIFVNDSTYIHNYQLLKSPFKLVGCLACLQFTENKADIGGSDIYGGWIDWSVSEEKHMSYNTEISNYLNFTGSNPHSIASDPTRICMCKMNVPDCTITNVNVSLYPGQTISVELVAVGQRFGTVLAHVTAELENNRSIGNPPARIGELQGIQTVQKTCTSLSYTIFSLNEEETLLITGLKKIEFGHGYHQFKDRIFRDELLQQYPDKLGILFEQFSIKRKLNNCPFSFQLNKKEYSCNCPSFLKLYGLSCDSTNYRIIRSGQQWVGVAYDCSNSGNSTIIAHRHCPFDYCKTDIRSLSITSEYNNELCAFNRAGILCGGCNTNYSRVLGSSKCKVCSNIMIIAIIPGSILAGILLIIILMILNLTVSAGTINGLIFYANIIQAQRATFFTPGSINSFLSKFIALLNLDQGIESCFYNGLDSYTETWLQFCFPLYIWLLMTAIIVSSHYSGRASKLSGKNAVQVLATLFLLSFTKIVRLVIDVVSFTTLVYPNGQTKAVWLYDGNIEFLRGKHIPLFIASLLLLILISVPYTVTLVSIQWLFKLSHYRIMFWVQSMKPFFDAYTGPYRPKHRYWTGLLLLARIALLVIFSLNQKNNPAINTFSIALFSNCLLAWLYLSRWVYESWLNNCLELIFLLNLSLTSTTILFEDIESNESRSSAVIYTSTGITFVIFIGIILYHAQKQFFQTRVGTKIKNTFYRLHNSHRNEDEDGIQLQVSGCKIEESPKQVTHTVVELTQPLLKKEEEEKEC